METKKPKRIIIDTDGGVDDFIAVILALNCPEELKVEAITTVFGNVGLDIATLNVLRMLDTHRLHHNLSSDFTSSSLPKIYKGCDKPIASSRKTHNAVHIHGEDGLGGATQLKSTDGLIIYPAPSQDLHEGHLVSDRHAVDEMLALCSRYPNEITIVTLGPITNVATAANKNLEALRLAKEIVIMGGSFSGYGNITLSAEFNVYADPESLEIVLKSGIPITFVPLDVTMQVCLTNADLAPHLVSSLNARFIRDILEKLRIFLRKRRCHSDDFDVEVNMHDPLAIVVAMDNSTNGVNIIPETEEFRRSAFVQVETKGEFTSGKTLGDIRWPLPSNQIPNAKICYKVNIQNFNKLIHEKVLLPHSN